MYIRVAVFYFGAIPAVPSCRLEADSVVQSRLATNGSTSKSVNAFSLVAHPSQLCSLPVFRRLAGPLLSLGVCVSFHSDIPKQDAYRGSCDRDGL